MDKLLRTLAGRVGVEPARAGEALVPQVRFEQPWPQWQLLLIGLGSLALIAWIYRREGSAPGWYKAMLAALRYALVLLALFLLSEAVLSVERTGLPPFLVLIDDSASAGVEDQYGDARQTEAASALAAAAQKPMASRLAVAQGWLARDDAKVLRELQKNHKVKLYLVSTAARPFAAIDKPEDVGPAVQQLLDKVEPVGGQSRLGDGVEQVLTEHRGVPP